MNVNNRWKPVETYQTKSISESQTEEQHVKRKFKSIDDVMMGSNTLAQHKTYHVPPGKKFVVFLKLLGILGFPGVLEYNLFKNALGFIGIPWIPGIPGIPGIPWYPW